MIRKFLLMMGLSCAAMASETTFVLVRHGETDWNKAHKVQGHVDIPLNEKGLLQAEETAQIIFEQHPDISAIYSSDLSRAYETALKTAKLFNFPVKKRESLREVHPGISDGMLISEKVKRYDAGWRQLEKDFPDRKERWKQVVVEGEESLYSAYQRIASELKEIAKNHPGEKVAIFAHGKVIRALVCELMDIDVHELKFGNCELAQVKYNDELAEDAFSLIQ